MTLRLLCDEHVDRKALFPQVRREFTARHVLDVHGLGAGAADADIWRHAVQINYNVLTKDSDFIDGSANPGTGTHPGVFYYDGGTSHSSVVTALQGVAACTSSSTLATNDEVLYLPATWPQYAP